MRTPRLLTATLLACFHVAALADDKTFTVGVEDYPNFLPYSAYQDNIYSGLGKDILDAFAKQHGYTFKYEVYPLKRRDRLFTQGKLDFAFPDNPNWVADLKKNLKISYAPMLEFTDGVLVRPENKGKGLARLKILGVPLGFTPYPYQQLMSTGSMRLEETLQYDSLYQKLVADRVDGAYMNTRIARYYWSQIKKYEQAPVVYDPDLPHASGFWCFSSSKHPAIIEKFKQFLLNNKGKIDELKSSYQFKSSDDNN
ncbi:amino acid ABC transporter substrate-binding protein [Chitinimonas arctica]|uniref:Amino acid ABC transporter substrate-binding protein n=1 Tax=Chitinimonas arctica TaxID=2594795 RepID=A0A516SFR2_9NEIS|nr:transporter substrate-binding domain-containing protein [Chitinimonas arctica]QDQ26994.1 amino acid ABC transporter substrate-binding protein [Chitinimonas arctica]